jgi:hypothetical protein
MKTEMLCGGQLLAAEAAFEQKNLDLLTTEGRKTAPHPEKTS